MSITAKKNYIYSTKEGSSGSCACFFDKQAAAIFTGSTIPSNELIYRGGVYSFIVCEIDGDNRYSNAMMVNLDASAFNQLYCQYSDDDSLLYRLENNTIPFADKSLSDIKTNHPVIQQIAMTKQPNGSISIKQNNKKTAFIYSYLPDPQLYYVRRINFNSLDVQLKNFRLLSVQVILIILAAWGLVSLLTMVRLYIPLKKVVNSLTNDIGENSADSDSILNNLDEWVQGAAADKKEYINALKEEYLKQLLISPLPDNHSVQHSFQKYNISLTPTKPVFLMLSVSQNLPEIRGIKYVFECITFNGKRIFILQLEKEEDRYIFFSQLVEKADTVVCCSEKIINWRNIRHSYERLREVFSMKIFYPKEKVFFENILDSHKKESKYPELLENKLLQMLKNGNYAESTLILDKFISFLSEYRYTTIVFGLKRLYLILTSFYHKMLTDTETNQLKYGVDYITSIISQAENLECIKEEYYEIMHRICDASCEIQISKQKKISDQIKFIIQSQFQNALLSPAVIADEMQFSDTYISKIFKSSEKISISDYINKIRMKQAALLLKETDLTVKEITEKIGINNSQYFFVLFKKYSGLSPAKYRIVEN